jgi:integrase
VAINKRGDKYVVDWWTDGKRYRKFFDRQHDARDYAAKVRDEKRLGTHVATDRIPLFREAAFDWLSSRGNRKPSTFAMYRGHIETHLIPAFGDKRLDHIDVGVIEKWRGALGETLAANTVSGIVQTLSQILKREVAQKRLMQNPCMLLERSYTPTDQTDEHKRTDAAITPDELLDANEIRKLLEAAKPGFERTLFALAAGTGAREGELLALRWSDVVFDPSPKILIRQSLSWARGSTDDNTVFHFGVPKTKSGRREIPIDAHLVRLLKEWKLQAGRNSRDLLFAQADDRPIRRSNLWKMHFAPALKRAGLRHVKFHSLRHSYASALIKLGAPVTEVAARLGHKNPGITLGIYSHWFKTADSGAASAYSDALFGTDSE